MAETKPPAIALSDTTNKIVHDSRDELLVKEPQAGDTGLSPSRGVCRSGATRSFLAARTHMQRATINSPNKRLDSSRAGRVATYGMLTETSSSNTEWGCDQSRWATRLSLS